MPAWQPASREVQGAAVTLAAVMFAHTWAQQPPTDAEPLDPVSVACNTPREHVAHQGWTSDVFCFPGTGEDEAVRGPVRLLFGLTLDLNRADAQALEVLPRIGPRRAAAIVAARTTAPFDSLSDLERIAGIGPATVAGLVGLADTGGVDAGTSP